MTNAPINFRQERDFGDLFNATFGFISQEFKKLATAILYFVVPFFLLAAIAMTIYNIKAQDLMLQAIVPGEKPNPLAVFSAMGSLISYVGVALILSIIASSMMFCTVYGYIRRYVQYGSGGFSINDVWLDVTKYFWPVLGAAFVTGLIILAGTIFCLIPGIYFGVALCIIFCIMIFEDQKFPAAFRRSFKLVKTNWWLTFGALLIAIVIVYIMIIFLSIPSILMGFKSMFANLKSGQNVLMDMSMGFYIVSSLTGLLTQVLLVIPTVLIAFLYFSFVEKAEKPSLMDKIDHINDNE